MKHTRLIAILMAIMMLAGMLGVTAYADETVYEETDTYVLNFDGEYEGLPYQYVSPYYAKGPVVGRGTPSIGVHSFSLYNTLNEEIIHAYCVDGPVNLNSETDYRRLNLEDAPFAAASAGLLRSIVRNGFPVVSVEELGKAANVDGLTIGEAVAATQYAIWTAVDPEAIQYNDFYSSYYNIDYWKSSTVHADDCSAEILNGYGAVLNDKGNYTKNTENEPTIEAHIETVYNYLLSLEPTAPTGSVASEASFVAWNITASEADENGNCTVTATATVDVTVGANDSLTLTAIAGDHTTSAALIDGKNDYTLTIENVPADAVDTLSLAIDGTQQLDDVYYFDAVGDRNASQSLIGITGSALPVHAEVSKSDRIVTIHKTDDSEDRNGLENITFDFYYVCSIDEYVNGDVILGTGIVTIEGKDYFSSPTKDDIKKYTSGATYPVVTVTTDANGDAAYNFGTDNDGIYLVIERNNPAIEIVANPFFVAIPGGAEAGSDLCKIDIQPKNTVKTEDILIEKDVTKIDNEHNTYDVGENHTWIIQSSIPEGIGSGLKFEVSDTLDSRLTLVSVDRVAIAADAGSFGNSEDPSYVKDENETPAFDDAEIVLAAEHYTVTVADDNSGFVMALTPAGMAYVAEQVGADYDNYEIRTYFTAYINSTAGLGENIPNQAHVDYTNNVGTDYDADSDKPEVHTGGLKVIKTDAANGNRLAGATFTLNELNEDGTYTVVATATTDANGEALFSGVAYGTYYLIETEAPNGYNLLTESVEVTINAISHLDDNLETADVVEGGSVTVLNSSKFKLPETGGIGTLIFTLGGSSLFAAAGALLVDTKRKSR